MGTRDSVVRESSKERFYLDKTEEIDRMKTILPKFPTVESYKNSLSRKPLGRVWRDVPKLKVRRGIVKCE